MTTFEEFIPLFLDDNAETNAANVKTNSEFDLVQNAANGDKQAFEKLYWQHHQRVFSVCYRMTKNVSESEDLTQMVFIQLFKKLGSFRGDSAFSTWLHRLTVNLVLMHFRKKRTIKEQTTEDGTMPDSFEFNGRKQTGNQVVSRILLNEAIEKLPKGYRQILILHDICGYEHQEIGEMLDCSSGTSKSQLFKARRKLRKLLASETNENKYDIL